ncbi:hypothetical protein RRG08_037987 [Elysia crispata]|uniref:Uncharacterized protein n=1 Tax=Elysia crispata TaxID=231223 RepID=A0AAE1ACJ4_9GAST|nr:hypothetical protein RRG08_037987 [Elysia crispata]
MLIPVSSATKPKLFSDLSPHESNNILQHFWLYVCPSGLRCLLLWPANIPAQPRSSLIAWVNPWTHCHPDQDNQVSPVRGPRLELHVGHSFQTQKYSQDPTDLSVGTVLCEADRIVSSNGDLCGPDKYKGRF